MRRWHELTVPLVCGVSLDGKIVMPPRAAMLRFRTQQETGAWDTSRLSHKSCYPATLSLMLISAESHPLRLPHSFFPQTLFCSEASVLQNGCVTGMLSITAAGGWLPGACEQLVSTLASDACLTRRGMVIA